MALVIPPGYAQASIELRNAGDPDPWFITFGVDVSAAGGDFESAAVNCALSFSTTIGLQLSTSTQTVGCNLSVGQDGPDRLITRFILPNATFGTSAAAMLPQNCAALYDKITTRAGRRGRGRFFMPSILGEGDVNAVGVIASAAVLDLQVQANNFLSALRDGVTEGSNIVPTPMVLLHNEGIGITVPDFVSGLVVQNVISTQRRRLR